MKKWIARIVILSLILGALYYQPVKAADLYVSTSGSDTSNCQASPCRTIGYAVSQAATNDTIHVAAGTYNTETTWPISISKNLTLQGAGASTTTIDGTGHGVDAIDALSAIVNISGFTIKGDGYGLYYNGSSGTITNNTITGNHDGIFNIYSSNPTITNNTIRGNSNEGISNNNSSNPTITNNVISTNGTGIYNSYSDAIISGNTITQNGVDTGIYNYYSNPTIINNIIANNDIGIENSYSSPTITNNTITGNGTDGIDNENSSNPTITNNIIASNQSCGIYAVSSSNPTNTYNDVWGSSTNYGGTATAGTGSISADPLFIGGGDYHLQGSSPAKDAGNNSASAIPATDKDGNARISCGRVDMGAYEIQCPKIKKKLIPSLLPAVQNHISQGNELLKQANDLLSQAKSKNLDTSTCEKQINEVNELLEKANKVKASPITANYFALKAIAKLTQAIECLKTLIS